MLNLRSSGGERSLGRLRPGRLLGPAAGVMRCLMTAVAVAGVVAFAGFLVAPKLLGLETRTVVTGSMEPTIPVGSVLFVAPQGVEDIRVGDVAVFRVPDRTEDVVHRIVGVEATRDGITYRTRGDANRQDDPWLLPSADVVGVVRGHLPVIGHAVPVVTSRLGVVLLLAVPAMAIILMELPVWYRFVRYGAVAFEVERHAGGEVWSGRRPPDRSGQGAGL